MKKIEVLVCIFLSIVTASNVTAHIDQKLTSNVLYMGVGVGGVSLSNRGNMLMSGYTGGAASLNGRYLMKTLGINRFFGYTFVGYEKFIKQFCIAGEFLLEVAERKTSGVKGKREDEVEYEQAGDFRFKNKGLFPELTVKVGYVNGSDTFYVKTGIAKPASSFLTANVEIRNTTIAPVIYLGLSKTFKNDWKGNIEIGYQFHQKKNYVSVKKNIEMTFRFGKGWKIRAGIARAIHL